MKKTKLNYLHIILLAIFLFLWTIPVWGQTVSLQETDLYPGGSAAVIHVASNGSLFILDRADELWIVDPITGDYKDFYGISGVDLYDIDLETSELVWWTDASQMFGSLNTTTNQVKSWDITEIYNDLPNLGPLSYDNGYLWITEWFGGYNGLFRFNTSDSEMCLFKASIHASDVIFFEEKLYVLDWYLDALLRLDPVTGQLVKFDPGRLVGLESQLETDGTRLWWTEDSADGDIFRFDPETLSLTIYGLPTGEKPRNLTSQSGIIWYTNANGSFGRLNPSIVTGVTSVLSGELMSAEPEPNCVILGEPVLEVANREPDGTFVWSEIDSSIDEPFAGLQTYSLPTNAEPFGITDTPGFIWLTDPGRQKLIRMAISDEPTEDYRIYLPLIIK